MSRRMVENKLEVYIRTCQECFNQQEGKDPSQFKKDLPDTWLNTKCKKCKSEALDYGSWRNITEAA